MHAIERLRYVARAGEVESTELATEAAYALAGLSGDRFALVLACRRLLDFYPDCGALWWVCAHLLHAADVRSCAASLIEQLEMDASVDELMALPASSSVVVAQATRTIVRALYERIDLPVHLVGDPYALRSCIRFFADAMVSPCAHLPDEVDEAMSQAGLAVVEARAASSSGILLDETGIALAKGAVRAQVPLYVVAGVGRILPAVLFDASVAASTLARREDSDHFDRRDDLAIAGLASSDRPGLASPRDIGPLEEVTHIFPAEHVHAMVTDRGVIACKVALHVNPGVSHMSCPTPGELIGPSSR